MPRLRPRHLVLALTLFAAAAVGTTGALLLGRYRSAALDALADRQALLVSLQAHLIDAELTRLVTEISRLSQLAEVDLADGTLEPEKRVLRIARRDTALFSVAIALLDARGTVLWSEPQGTTLAASGPALVGEARGQQRTVLSIAPGELDVAAPIAGQGAMVGQVRAAGRGLFGEALQRVGTRAGGMALLHLAPGRQEEVIATTGEPLPAGLAGGGTLAWRSDARGRRWLVTEARLRDAPLALRMARPAAELEQEVAGTLGNLFAIVGVALVLATLGGALLARAIGKLERVERELGTSRELAAMGRTAAAIAHEVKNSLNGLSIAVDLLAGGRAPASAVAEVHAQARSEIARLRGVADDLTLFAAPPRLDWGDADVEELCRRAVAGVAGLAGDYGVSVALDPGDGGPLRVRCDAHKLLGALQNVVRNGVEAMGPGAFGEELGAPGPARERRLEVALRRDGPAALVEVADRGPGIPSEVAAHLFEPFVTTKRGGTGLGLAIARRVVEAHGGTIAALPRPGGGTIFRVALPAAGDAAPARGAPTVEAMR